MAKRLKILCLCSQGNNRSVAMGYLCKSYGWDSIAAGVDANSLSTVGMLAHWADFIWIAKEEMRDKIDPSVHHKIVGPCVGEDIWGYTPHPELLDKVTREIFPQIATAIRIKVDKEKS